MGREVEKIGPPIMILAALLIETDSRGVLFEEISIICKVISSEK